MKINDIVFRAYDIRGIYGTQLDEDFAYKLGLSFGNIIKKEDKYLTVVGYDNRASSLPLSKKLIEGLNDSGVNVINIGMVTTPMLYSSWTLLKVTSGIMITASHNPKEYNGFKISLNGTNNSHGEEIQMIKREMLKEQPLSGKRGETLNKDIKEEYIKFLTKDLNIKRKLKVVIDAGNGSASAIVDKLFNTLNVDYIPLFTNSDPDYPNHHPNPSEEKNMQHLIEKVKETNADVGFGFDGDADRVGMVDENGNIVPVDHLMIIALRDLLPKLKDKRIVYDVKCSNSLKEEILKLGGIPVEMRTGNSFLRAKIVEDNIAFGGEFSGHVFFNDTFPGYDDGVYASLRLIEIISNSNKKVSELTKNITKYYSSPLMSIRVREDNKFELVERIKEYCKEMNYEYLDIDGCKVMFKDGFALIRASNTGPDLTLRYEFTTEKRLIEVEKEFDKKIKEMLN